MALRTTPATEGRAPLPVWVIYGLRPLALFIAFATLIIGGIINSDGGEFDAPSMAIAVGVLTIVGFAYIFATLFITNITKFHNTIAVFAIDALLWVLWLVTMAVSARRFAQFRKGARGVSTMFGGNAYTSIRDKLAGILALSLVNFIIFSIFLALGCKEITLPQIHSDAEKPVPTTAAPVAANTEMNNVAASPEYNNDPNAAPYPSGNTGMPPIPTHQQQQQL